jgi:hypothetical protein
VPATGERFAIMPDGEPVLMSRPKRWPFCEIDDCGNRAKFEYKAADEDQETYITWRCDNHKRVGVSDDYDEIEL